MLENGQSRLLQRESRLRSDRGPPAAFTDWLPERKLLIPQGERRAEGATLEHLHTHGVFSQRGLLGRWSNEEQSRIEQNLNELLRPIREGQNANQNETRGGEETDVRHLRIAWKP